MEFLNKVELKGVVGRVDNNQVADTMVTRLSLVTNYSDKDRDGNEIIETMWWNVIAYDIPNAENAQKGDNLHLIGRLRQTRYTDQYGNPAVLYDVIAIRVAIVGKEAY